MNNNSQRIESTQTQEKTKKTKIKTSFSLLHALLIFAAITIFSIPLVHKLFPKKNSAVEIYKKELRKEVNDIETKIKENRLKYDNRVITAEYFIEINDVLTNERDVIESRNEELIKLKANQERFIGWLTVRKFFIGFGVRFPFLFLTVILSFLIYKLNTEEKYLKRALFFLQVSCYGLSFYFMFWVFWTSQDYPVSAYRVFFILFSLSAALFTVYFIMYRNIFKTKLEIKLKGIIAYVLEIRNKHIPKMAINALEVDEKGTILGINEFEQRTIEELDKVAVK
ncbi:hypothetical protein [Tenacibaculum maritimum]|uniref:hypothetical protein n=1 Tax=Tenacibaculum maritimum TaxID=107401 RepID=UPI001330FB7D|nr:hypothetical protein [Tenacibaculum maritimum]